MAEDFPVNDQTLVLVFKVEFRGALERPKSFLFSRMTLPLKEDDNFFNCEYDDER